MKKVITLLLVLAFALAMCGFSTDFTVTGSLVTDGEEDEMVANSYAVVSVSTDSAPYVIAVDAYIGGSEAPYRAIFTVDGEGFGFSFPDFDENYYKVNWDVFKDAAEEYSPVDLDEISLDDVPVDDLAEIGERYANIVIDLMTEENTTFEEGAFTLPWLEKTPECQILTICPSQADWEAFITNAASTAQADTQLRALIEKGLDMAYSSGQVDDADQYASAEEFVAAGMASFDEFLTAILQDPASIAEQIAGLTLEAGYTEDYFYGARLTLNGMGIGYESFTEPAEDGDGNTRYDGLFYYEGEGATAILCNSLNLTESGFTTYAFTEFADAGLQAYADFADTLVFNIPSMGLLFNIEETSFEVGAVDDEGVAVFYADVKPDESNEFYIQAASDGSPSDVTAPNAEPVAVTSVDELMNVLSSIFSTVSE